MSLVPHIHDHLAGTALVGAVALALGACSSPSDNQQASNGTAVNGAGDASAGEATGVSTFGASPAASGAGDSEIEAFVTRQLATPEPVDETARLVRLKPLDGFEPSVVIGPDDRRRVNPTTVYPARATVLITSNGGRCSGVMIGPDTVLTAGHCLHGGPGGSWSSNVAVYPGRNGNSAPFGSCLGRQLFSVLGWTRDGNPDYDYGAIKLNCAIGNTVGWFGFWWQSAMLTGTPAEIAGYPGERRLEQWIGSDSVRRDTGLRVFYNTDTTPGNSGSGVYSPAGSNHCRPGPCVHAVHAYGSTSGNSGPRMTQAMFQNVVAWRSAR